MNNDQMKGKLKEGAGEAQEHIGRALGNEEQEAKGHAREQDGKLQKESGDQQEQLKNTDRRP